MSWPTYLRKVNPALGRMKWALLSRPYLRRALLGLYPSLIRRSVARPSMADYHAWIEQYDTHEGRNLEILKERSDALSSTPLISIILPVYNAPLEVFRQTIQSVLDQVYTNWELCIADDCSSDLELRAYLAGLADEDRRIKVAFREHRGHISEASNTALALATGEFVGLLDHDDVLAVNALLEVAWTLTDHPSVDLIYSDEDKIDAQGARFEPYFKSDWNLDLLYGQNYVNHFGVYRTAVVRRLGGFRKGYEGSQDYDLVLRFIETIPSQNIRHIPKILYHWRASVTSTAADPNAKRYAVEASRRALRDHFRRTGKDVEVLPVAGCQHHRVRWTVNDPGLVSVIVATRDRHRLLQTCVTGLRQHTDYPNVELIVVDNGSTEPASVRYLRHLESTGGTTVIRSPGPFNFSKLANTGARIAGGAYLLFMNNDVEMIDDTWLTEMVSHGCRENVGVVGARLLFPDDRIQHAGVRIGVGGVAGHVFKGWHKHDLGYKGRTQLAQDVSAVTGACMLVKRRVFDEVGGFDARHLQIAFNDIDFCLKARKLGYLIVWTPFATLIHHESASRGSDRTPVTADRFQREFTFMQRTWRTDRYEDPYFNPNLSLDSTDIRLACPPRVSSRLGRQELEQVA